MSKNQKVFAGVVGVVVLLAILIGGNLVSLQGATKMPKDFILEEVCFIYCENGSGQYKEVNKSCKEVTTQDIEKACGSK